MGSSDVLSGETRAIGYDRINIAKNSCRLSRSVHSNATASGNFRHRRVEPASMAQVHQSQYVR